MRLLLGLLLLSACPQPDDDDSAVTDGFIVSDSLDVTWFETSMSGTTLGTVSSTEPVRGDPGGRGPGQR